MSTSRGRGRRLALPVAGLLAAAVLMGASGHAASSGAEPLAPTAAHALPPAAPPAQTAGDGYGIGQPASAEAIRPLDIDVRPDGAGLPPGQGTPAEGRALYGQHCAVCHGPTGREGGAAEPLVSTEPWRPGVQPTVGNYWPYATTIYDYINRAMPLDRPGSLTADEVYAVTAYLLHENGLLAADAVLDARLLPTIRMPNVDAFTSPDPRPDVP
jgi:S-disulfanyl-L-cysteine oxidoreductase SoxD